MHDLGDSLSGKRAKQVAQKNKRLQKKIADLFEYRYLFVKRTVTHKEKKILQSITRGLDQLRTLRAIMDEVYRLFDRRCRMDTALEKLAQLRRRIKRFSTLKFDPTPILVIVQRESET